MSAYSLIRTFLGFFQIYFFFVIVVFIVVPGGASAAVNPGGEIHYDIDVHIDPITRAIEGQSKITVTNPRELNIVLGSQFEVTQALIDGHPLGKGRQRANQPHAWQIPYDLRPQYHIEIHWRGELLPLDASLDHEQTLGRPLPVSGEAGTYLPNGSNWYPRIVGGLAHYEVKLALPSGQRGLVAGRLLAESDSDQGYQAHFEFPFPAEGITLMAGPYEIATDTYIGMRGEPIQLRTYFHPQLSNLSNDYIEAVKRYLKLYEPWIGSYPFTEFSVVSSPTPTGFGMPTLTYLGINVLQLPFIRDTSLGHEVLHNWWGNGVYPDYQSGNWSEGLTTFMADYAYKERESDEAAREMRLGWLRDFAALEPGQDAPLASFTSRTHGASKIVGYNKAAMFFFMLRDQLGTAVFDRSIQGLWKTRRFKVTSWQRMQQTFQIISGQNLEPFFTQWLDRAGAPAIAIAAVKNSKADAGYALDITLKQSSPTYQLSVPVAIETEADTEMHRLDLQQNQQTFTLTLQNKPLSVTLDPDLRLFRQLATGEAPPILREVMVNPTTKTILLSDERELRHIAETLASSLQRRSANIVSSSAELSAAPTLVIGLQDEIDAWLAAKNLSPRPEIVSEKGSAQAWTMTHAKDASLAIISAQDAASLEALIRPLPHYGRQSYIMFDGRQALDRGTWPMQVQRVEVD
ncbi:MAG: M1 family peptidase [Betaproteobacteria bacterium]|nr:M1 family peptidase [Betaproteobacteria bacterium]